MRASQWLLGLATATTIMGAIASGCGGSSNDNGTQDSGADVTTDVVSEPAVEAASEAASDAASEACAVDADLSTLPIPDADIGDTGKPVSGCVSCIETACPSLISTCNASCACKTAFIAFAACFGSGQSVLTCAQAFASGSGIPITGLACALGCGTPCGQPLPAEGGSEGGGEGGGDTGTSDATGQ